MEIPCTAPQCPFVGDDLQHFCNHLRRLHSHMRSFKFTCFLEGCGVTLNHAASVRAHFQRLHPDLWEATGPEAIVGRIVPPDEICNEPAGEELLAEANNEKVDERQVAMSQFSTMMTSLRSALPSAFLKLQYKHGVPSRVARRIHEEYINMFCLLSNGSNSSLARYAAASEFNDNNFKAMLTCMEVNDICRTSTHKEAEQLKKLGYVCPEEVDFRLEAEKAPPCANALEAVQLDEDDVDAVEGWGTDAIDDASDSDESAHYEDSDEEADQEQQQSSSEEDDPDDGSKHVYHYVSIIETLKAYLKHDDVVAEVRAGPSAHQGDGVYDDYTSGRIYRESVHLNRGVHHLRINLYTDEITVTNALQGHSKKHKLAVVYFLVLNIAPESQSVLASIHLVAVARWDLVKQYSYAAFFRRIIAEFHTLEGEGFEVETLKGERIHFTGSLVNVSADNLSAHALGGFRCSFSSGKICRYCFISHENMRGMTSEMDPQCELRTVENVLRHAREGARSDFYRKLYGLAGESCLYAVPNFSPVTHLAPDVMHDILESFMPCHVRNLLKALTKRPAVISFPKIRKAIRAFRYHKADSKNKPPTFPEDWASKKKGIGGTAAEKWNLFRLLPFMIRHYIPEDNKNWQLFKLALKIAEIILCFRVTDEVLDELANLIHEHHILWVELYPDCFPCKFHYLIHYPRLFREHGVLRRLWTTRFESFHHYIKNILLKGRNFINETKTASERFQKMRALQYADGCGLPVPIEVTGSSHVCTLGSVEPMEARQHVAQLLRCDNATLLTKVSAVKYKGITLYPDCYNVVAMQHGGVPLFLKTMSIYLHEDTVVLYGCAVTTVDFIDHFQAYHVEERQDEVLAIAASDLASSQTLASYDVHGRQMIRLRFRPVVD